MNNLRNLQRIKRVSKTEAFKNRKVWGISNPESATAYELGYIQGYRAGALKTIKNHGR